MSDIQAIRARHEARVIKLSESKSFKQIDEMMPILRDMSAALSALSAAEARAEAAEARVKYLQIIIDCVVANCEASASSYQERIETIHRVTSALALEWAEDHTLKGATDGR